MQTVEASKQNDASRSKMRLLRRWFYGLVISRKVSSNSAVYGWLCANEPDLCFKDILYDRPASNAYVMTKFPIIAYKMVCDVLGEEKLIAELEIPANTIVDTDADNKGHCNGMMRADAAYVRRIFSPGSHWWKNPMEYELARSYYYPFWYLVGKTVYPNHPINIRGGNHNGIYFYLTRNAAELLIPWL
jgi:hypothetical protein